MGGVSCGIEFGLMPSHAAAPCPSLLAHIKNCTQCTRAQVDRRHQRARAAWLQKRAAWLQKLSLWPIYLNDFQAASAQRRRPQLPALDRIDHDHDAKAADGEAADQHDGGERKHDQRDAPAHSANTVCLFACVCGCQTQCAPGSSPLAPPHPVRRIAPPMTAVPSADATTEPAQHMEHRAHRKLNVLCSV